MGRGSIKIRVTLWYTVWMALLLFAGLAYIFWLSDRILLEQSRNSLRAVVREAAQSIKYEDGRLDLDDVTLYKNGVSLFLYDSQGRIIAPRDNLRGYVNAVLESGELKIVEEKGESWMVYDCYEGIGGFSLWLRGSLLVSDLYRILQMMRLVALCSVPLFLAAAAGGGYLITRRAFRPIGEIRSTAEKMEEGRDLSQRIETEHMARDEVRQLAETFNRMFERLEASFHTEKQFTSDASHELRTPTAIIISQCEYAARPEASPEETQEALGVILRQAKKMSSLIAKLLMLARADNGRWKPEWEQVDAEELCRMVAEELEPMAEAAGVRLVLQLEPDTVITADQTQLLQAVTNLLQNAICYSGQGTAVTLSLKKSGGYGVFTVSDEGIGIPEQELSKIWNRFYRASNGGKRPGTGLGLSIVAWVAKSHHGTVKAESRLGKGSTFTLSLPEQQEAS